MQPRILESLKQDHGRIHGVSRAANALPGAVGEAARALQLHGAAV